METVSRNRSRFADGYDKAVLAILMREI